MEKERIIEEKQRVVEEMQRVVEEKQRVIEEKEGKERMMERMIEEKERMIVGIRESSDRLKALTEMAQKPKPVQKWGERIHVFRFITCHGILQAQ